jgi:hypothetical protein
VRPQSREKRVPLTLTISPLLRRELEIEAWESKKTLTEYVRGLLASRGKFARTVGAAGGYLLASPESIRPIPKAAGIGKKHK